MKRIARMHEQLRNGAFFKESDPDLPRSLTPIYTPIYVHHLGRLGAKRAMMPKPTATAIPLSSTIAIRTYIRKSTTRGVIC
jgi:hypothetical protein